MTMKFSWDIFQVTFLYHVYKCLYLFVCTYTIFVYRLEKQTFQTEDFLQILKFKMGKLLNILKKSY